MLNCCVCVQGGVASVDSTAVRALIGYRTAATSDTVSAASNTTISISKPQCLHHQATYFYKPTVCGTTGSPGGVFKIMQGTIYRYGLYSMGVSILPSVQHAIDHRPSRIDNSYPSLCVAVPGWSSFSISGYSQSGNFRIGIPMF